MGSEMLECHLRCRLHHGLLLSFVVVRWYLCYVKRGLHHVWPQHFESSFRVVITIKTGYCCVMFSKSMQKPHRSK